MNVAENLAHIKQDIEKACLVSDRAPKDITIIAVTKYVSIERTKQAIAAGITHLGENRLEGFLEKYNELKDTIQWHFIGSLQSRKVKDVIKHVDYIHSLDRLSLAKEINKRAENKVSCFIQVNVSGEKSKHGLSPENVESFIKECEQFPNIKIVGLMTMAPFVEDENILRSCFQKLRQLRDNIQSKGYEHAPCDYLSMGMSNDYEIAIEEGATHIRIGTKLVGNEVQ